MTEEESDDEQMEEIPEENVGLIEMWQWGPVSYVIHITNDTLKTLHL